MNYIEIKNVSGATVIWAGIELADDAVYIIPSTVSDRQVWQKSDAVITAIGNGDAQVGNGDTFLTSSSEAMSWFMDYNPPQVQSMSFPFASKVTDTGSKLFRRVHGISSGALTAGQKTSIRFTIPYTRCKITTLEIIGAEVGDVTDFSVYDSTTGVLTGVPNYKLNQFGFDVNLSAEFHRDRSNYDADLVAGLQIELDYMSVSNKSVGINVVLHEVV